MSDLSQRAQELLRAGRSGIEPGPGAAERVRDKLAEAIEAAPGSGNGSGGAGGAAGTGAGVKAALAIIGVSAAIALAYMALRPTGGEAPPSATDPVLVAAAPPAGDAAAPARAAARDAAPEPAFEPVEETVDAGAPFVRERTARRARARDRSDGAVPRAREPEVAAEQVSDEAPEQPAPARSLMDELRFIEGARSLLSSGSPERALEVIERHADEFPAGQLGQEAAEIRVRALCAADRRDAAEEAASRLGERWPGSPFAARHGPVCGS